MSSGELNCYIKARKPSVINADTGPVMLISSINCYIKASRVGNKVSLMQTFPELLHATSFTDNNGTIWSCTDSGIDSPHCFFSVSQPDMPRENLLMQKIPSFQRFPCQRLQSMFGMEGNVARNHHGNVTLTGFSADRWEGRFLGLRKWGEESDGILCWRDSVQLPHVR